MILMRRNFGTDVDYFGTKQIDMMMRCTGMVCCVDCFDSAPVAAAGIDDDDVRFFGRSWLYFVASNELDAAQ